MAIICFSLSLGSFELNPHLKDSSLFWLYFGWIVSICRFGNATKWCFSYFIRIGFGDCSNTFCFIFICTFDHFQRDVIDFLLLTLGDVHLIESASLDKWLKPSVSIFSLSSLNEDIIKLKEFSTLTLDYNSCF